jgi:hypothetical protein
LRVATVLTATMEVAMAKAKRKSSAAAPSSPQLAFYFNQLRERVSPAVAIKYLTDEIAAANAIPVPALPENWRLEADGETLFVVSPAGRRDAREFSLRKNILKPAPTRLETMLALYPGDAAPVVSPPEQNREKARPGAAAARPKGGNPPHPIWSELVEPHFDDEVKRNGPFPSLGKARDAVIGLLQEKKKAVPHDRTIERHIRKYRPGWVLES